MHVFYYPWYGNPDFTSYWRHWQQGGFTPPLDIGSNYYPVLWAYDAWDFSGAVDTHMKWISECRIGVIVYSWWGQDSYEDHKVIETMNVADKYGIKVNWHLEPYEGRTAASVVDDINYINSRYGSHPAFSRDPERGNQGAFSDRSYWNSFCQRDAGRRSCIL